MNVSPVRRIDVLLTLTDARIVQDRHPVSATIALAAAGDMMTKGEMFWTIARVGIIGTTDVFSKIAVEADHARDILGAVAVLPDTRGDPVKNDALDDGVFLVRQVPSLIGKGLTT